MEGLPLDMGTYARPPCPPKPETISPNLNPKPFRAKNKAKLETESFEFASKAIGEAWSKLQEPDRVE